MGRRKGLSIIISTFVALMLIASPFGIVSLQFASAQSTQASADNNNNANSLNVQDLPFKKVHVGDIDVAYKIFGNGDPIVLLTGSGSVMDNWNPILLKNLASNHTVIIFDHRGVGNTTAGTKPFSMIQFANDTAGLMDALNIQKADVLGYSMGSFVAQQLALMHPEKLNRLVLYAASCGGEQAIPEGPDIIQIQSDFANNRIQNITKVLSFLFPESWIKSHANNLGLPQAKEIVSNDTKIKQFKVVQDWFSTNWSGVCDQLTKLTIPTLIVTGTEDVATPANNSLIIAQKIPEAWLAQFKGAGHGLMHQYPDELSNVIETFLTTTAQVSNALSTATATAAGTNNTTTATTTNTTTATAAQNMPIMN